MVLRSACAVRGGHLEDKVALPFLCWFSWLALWGRLQAASRSSPGLPSEQGDGRTWEGLSEGGAAHIQQVGQNYRGLVRFLNGCVSVGGRVVGAQNAIPYQSAVLATVLGLGVIWPAALGSPRCSES